jgi:membrane protein DedA with SNARE-associated domain
MVVKSNDVLMTPLALIPLKGALASYGYLAVFAFVGIESLGVPFPGETMLVTAAVYAGTSGNLSILVVIAAAATGAIIGDNLGFGIGRWGGYRLLVRYGKYVRLDQAKLKMGRYLFLRHGGKVVFFGRFISVLRTYAALLAGTNRIPWRRFLVFNAAGGVVWATLYGLGAYYLGHEIERVGRPVGIGLAVVALIVVVAALIFMRRSESRLEEEAERAFPGPLEGFPGGRPL